MDNTENTATTVESVADEGKEATTNTNGSTQEPFIVGETSVYKDVPSLLKGAIEKEKVIGELKNENKELREALTRLNNINNFKEELKKMTEENISNNGTENTSSISEEKIQEIALQAMLKKQQEAKAESNVAQAMQAVEEAFGGEAENKIEMKSKELGMTKEALKELAKNSPQAFTTLMGVQAPRQVRFEDLAQYSRSTPSAPQQSAPSELQKLKDNPSLYQDNKYMGDLFKRACADPSILGDFEWKTK